MKMSSAAKRKMGALAFGAAVPSVLLGTILVIGHAAAERGKTSDDVAPGPTRTSTPAPNSSRSTFAPPAPEALPPEVLNFDTDSTNGYLDGLPSNDLFGCQPVTSPPKKKGGKPVVTIPDTCKSRPPAK